MEKCRQRPTKRAFFGEKENVVLIFLGIAGLQGQFVRKSAKLSTQQKEGGEKLEAVKLVGCLMHPFSSGLRPWIILKQFCSPICPMFNLI